MPKMTTAQKVEYHENMAAKYRAQLAREAITEDVREGDEVTFTHGRADTKRALAGTVIGIREENNGRWVAVRVGEGFDETTYRIRPADITANPSADNRTGDPLNGE